MTLRLLMANDAERDAARRIASASGASVAFVGAYATFAFDHTKLRHVAAFVALVAARDAGVGVA